MSGPESLQSVQFVTVNGRRLAVIDAADWEALVDWLEEVEDRQILREAVEELATAGGDRQRAGWSEWGSVAAGIE
jgi:hypothetical protein